MTQMIPNFLLLFPQIGTEVVEKSSDNSFSFSVNDFAASLAKSDCFLPLFIHKRFFGKKYSSDSTVNSRNAHILLLMGYRLESSTGNITNGIISKNPLFEKNPAFFSPISRDAFLSFFPSP
ncbi:MAG: hypothetical protein K5739_07615 [Lachnospiraceae bacterium]|nr:hypothetical protein [Lachnospiraceae bacterium]